HAVIHPSCFLRLVQALGFDAPETRLEIPLFHLDAKDDDGAEPPVDIERLPPTPPDYLAGVMNGILSQQSRRRRAAPAALCVHVDGVERASFDPAVRSSVEVRLEPEADLIQVFAEDPNGLLLMSTLSLKFSGVTLSGRVWTSSSVLEAGQKIRMKVSPSTESG